MTSLYDLNIDGMDLPTALELISGAEASLERVAGNNPFSTAGEYAAHLVKVRTFLRKLSELSVNEPSNV